MSPGCRQPLATRRGRTTSPPTTRSWSSGCWPPARSSTARPTSPTCCGISQSYNDIYGTTNNPWDIARGPGGSSGGEAAALAAGLSALGAGSDIAGSLRNPAHYCGVYGHKPSWGLIPPRGHAPPGGADPDRHLRGRPDGAACRGSRPGDGRRSPVPTCLQQPAWRVELPTPRHRSLADFRVAVWTVSASARDRRQRRRSLSAATAAMGRAGASVDEAARPPIEDAEQHRLFMLLLRAAAASRLSDGRLCRAAGDRGDGSARTTRSRGHPRRRRPRRHPVAPRLGQIANEARTSCAMPGAIFSGATMCC